MAIGLTSQVGRSIWVGPIRITLVQQAGKQIRIGIECPPGYEVCREEILGTRPETPGKFEFPVPRPDQSEVETVELVIRGKQQG